MEMQAGLRMALGADRAGVLRMVLGRSLALVLAGLPSRSRGPSW
jgi:ABC-type antimicrobial peptide transport system permease subunit